MDNLDRLFEGVETKYKYDSSGNQIEKAVVNKNGTLRFMTRAEYDGNGNIIEERKYDRNASLTVKRVYSYNTLNEKVGMVVFDSKGRKNSAIEYNTNGNKSKETIYGNDATVKEQIDYEYDSNYMLKYETTHDFSDGEIHMSKRKEFDDNAELHEEIVYYQGGWVCSKTQYVRDEEGKLQETRMYVNRDNKMIKYTSKDVDNALSLLKRKICHYEKGNLIKVTEESFWD